MVSASNHVSLTTRGFVANVTVSDLYEIEAAQVALGRGSSADVREMAEMVIDDHTRMAGDLARLVTVGVVKAELPREMDERRQGLVDNLRQTAAEEFDKRYVDQQLVAHKEAITLHRGYAEHGDNEQLKRLAAEHLPLLEMHLEHAGTVHDSVTRPANER